MNVKRTIAAATLALGLLGAAACGNDSSDTKPAGASDTPTTVAPGPSEGGRVYPK